MAELPLTMPKMSMTMEEGTMVSWLKNEGDSIKSGEPVCEVATDKVDMEVESPFDGTLARITAFPDDIVKVGDPIAYVTTDADDLLGGLFDEPAPLSEAEGSNAAVVQPALGVSEGEAASSAAAHGWVPAVPLARRIAEENGIDLHSVAPSGPWGAVRARDVTSLTVTSQTPPERASETGATVASSGNRTIDKAPIAEEVPISVNPLESRQRRTRLLVAKVMSASAAVPQFSAYRDLDLTPLASVRRSTLGGASWTTILVKAQAMALRILPQLNGTWTDAGVEANEKIGIALAVDSPFGLLAPVVTDADRSTLGELGEEIRRLVEDARSGSLTADKLQGGTTVFSNLGGMGVDSFNALLTPPHATALSAGTVRERIVVRNGAFGPRLICTVGLTVDHRVADGADAARFLAALDEIISEPARLVSHEVRGSHQGQRTP